MFVCILDDDSCLNVRRFYSCSGKGKGKGKTKSKKKMVELVGMKEVKKIARISNSPKIHIASYGEATQMSHSSLMYLNGIWNMEGKQQHWAVSQISLNCLGLSEQALRRWWWRRWWAEWMATEYSTMWTNLSHISACLQRFSLAGFRF